MSSVKPVNRKVLRESTPNPPETYVESESEKSPSETNETPDPRVIQMLKDVGLKLSKTEMDQLQRRDAEEAEKRRREHDPPCVCCGTWSDNWLCPNCRKLFPWMHP